MTSIETNAARETGSSEAGLFVFDHYIDNHGRLLPDVSITLDGMPHIHATQIGKGT